MKKLIIVAVALLYGLIGLGVATSAAIADTTPDQFIFIDHTDVVSCHLETSNTITISGINAPTPISITGGGAYSINGSSYTYSSGTVNNGDNVTVQLSQCGYCTTKDTTLTIGGVSDTFSVTTGLYIVSQKGVELSTVIISGLIEVGAMARERSISITGGEYSLAANTDIFTSADGILKANFSTAIRVRLTSSASYSTTTEAILTIDGISYPFSVTTKDEYGDKWTKKANFGGIGRGGAVGFSIGRKGYIGTGGSSKDFWEYEPVADTWTQKADFGGGVRSQAVGFSIGNKGYIGTGMTSSPLTYYKDFWEYDPVKNIWTQKTDFGGTGRYSAVGFSIGSKGYIGTGWSSEGILGPSGIPIYTEAKDFWEYDPVADTWTQKANFGGGTRNRAAGFSIGNKGYIGTGSSYKNDFWEYDPSADTWTRKADFGGTGRGASLGFSIGSKGYIGTGAENDSPYKRNDFWEYDPATDTWTRRADLRGEARYNAIGFSIGSTGYIGTGWYTRPNYTVLKDLWAYEPSADTIPDQFIFNYEVDVDLNTVVTSNTITVSGINAPAPISITGGKYSINGGVYTNADGMVNNGDKVTVQLLSSGNYLTTTNATLTIGGVSDTFSVTTKEESIITLNPIANRTILWPPNNKMVVVTIKANAGDSSGKPVKLAATVSCNEPAKFGRDWLKPTIFQKSGVILVALRATRLGNGTGRIYTINITATGAAGNAVTKAVTVTVPHDQYKKRMR